MNPYALAKFIRNYLHCNNYHPEVNNWYRDAQAEHYARKLEVYLEDNLTIKDLNVLIARLNHVKMSRKAWKRLDKVILPKLSRMLDKQLEMEMECENGQPTQREMYVNSLNRGGQL